MNTVVQGAKSGSSKTRTPVIAQDSAQSKTYIKLQYGLSEGEIEGLVDGAKSIYLDDTPILDASGNANFDGVTWDFRSGTNDQTYMEGFPEVSNDTDVNVELKTSAWVHSISNTQIDAVRVRLRWGALRTTNASNGDVTGVTIKYAIDISTDGGAYVEMLNTQISDKTSANYERSHRIDLPQAQSGWNIRVRRITPPAQSDYVTDSMYVASYAEVIDVKFRYPNTALLGLQYDAENFSSVAKVAARAKGIKVRVPSNYDPVSREYVGIWDGSFKRAYSNNPAWIYYDLCTQKRYSLGKRITDSMPNKASLYRLSQYCDGLVSDGSGGLEPRFTCNVYIQSQEDAYTILSKLAGLFRAISYWDGDSIVCDGDMPQDVYFNYTNANVIDGTFEYSGTRARDRHTVARVAWSNPDNRFETEYEVVRDDNAIAKHGVKIVEVAAWGCTSRGQAQRAGLWAIRSEQYETQTVSFKVGLDGNIPMPGKVISVADNDWAGRFIGGRVRSVSEDLQTLTLDRDVIAGTGDTIYVNSESGQAIIRTIASVDGNTVTVSLAFDADTIAAQNAWTIDSSELATRKFRVMTIKQDEEHQFSITALEYNVQKYDAIDNGAYIQNAPVSIINPTTQDAAKNVTLSTYDQVQQGLNIATMVIQWDKADFAVKYLVEWKKDDGSWIKMPITGNTSVEIAGIYSGNYIARVTAYSAFDIASLPALSNLTTLSGKAGTPPQLASIAATGTMFGMMVKWAFPATGATDTAYTEIQYAAASDQSDAIQLGLYAYPTNSLQQQGLSANIEIWYRGRLVDRIGNVGPWSDWVQGISTANADEILDALDGQIGESQLDQALREKIDNAEGIQEVLDTVNNQWYVKVDDGNAVSGIAFGTEATGESQFLIRADRFAIAPPATVSDAGSFAFVYQATATTLPNGTTIPPGLYLNNAVIGSINANKINAESLSAISANLGDIQVGTANIADAAINGAKIGDLAVDTLKIADRAVTFPTLAVLYPNYSVSNSTVNTAVSLGSLAGYTVGSTVLVLVSCNLNASISRGQSTNVVVIPASVYILKVYLDDFFIAAVVGETYIESVNYDNSSETPSVTYFYSERFTCQFASWMGAYTVPSDIPANSVLSFKIVDLNDNLASGFGAEMTQVNAQILEFKK